jgi:hypothetical protein
LSRAQQLYPLGRDVCAARDQECLFVGEVEDLEAEGVNQHPVVKIDEVEPVDHSFAAKPAGFFAQMGCRSARKFVVEAEVDIHQQAVGKFPTD